MRALALLLAVTALGCKSDKAAASNEVSTGASDAALQKPVAEGTPTVGNAPSLPGRILLPPTKPGESLSQFEGCLAVATPSEKDGDAHPESTKSATRGGPAAPEVRITPTGGGLVIEHKLSHACCLTGAVETKVEGTQVTVTEKLTGDPCRCRCGSNLKTAVGLAPGTYDVKVEVDERGTKRGAHQQAVTVAP